MLKRFLLALTAAAAFLVATAQPAHAEDKFLGKVTKIELAGKTATVTLQDEAGKTVILSVEDKVTLDKFADKRIQVGDEIKAKFNAKGGKNVSSYFKKPGGC
jgi:TOBE domain-containing protein